jgi:transcriptional regulator with XRE-family HTH domain
VWVRPEEHKLVGECLAKARKTAGLTQAELAGLLKKPQSFVSSFESGQRRIDLLELLRIAHVLKADPRKIFAEIVLRKSREKA